MKWRIEFLPEVRVVRATTTGVVTADCARTVAQDLVYHLQGNQAAKFLVDHRDAELSMNLVELYYLAGDTIKIGLDSRYTGALVFAPDTSHDFRFYEVRMYNVGLRRKVFLEYDIALAWLESIPE